METISKSCTRGEVEFLELYPEARSFIQAARTEEDFQELFRLFGIRRFQRKNLTFNFPREQYAKLDRGEAPDTISANWLTLSRDPYTNPAVQTVTGETLRIQATVKAVDPTDPKNSIFRFPIDVGQFVGTWTTAILIGGSDADENPGTGKIIAAANNVKDDTNAPLNRDGTTIHIVNWKVKHLDSSEV